MARRRDNRRARRPDPALTQALEKVERAVDHTYESKQPRFGMKEAQTLFNSLYKWSKNELQNEPAYATDSRKRDKWLSEIWRAEPHISGVISSVVSIDKNRGWWMAGGRNQVNRYNAIMRRVEGGKGYRKYMEKGATAYYTTDMGFVSEEARDGGPDGPLRDLYFVDPTRCYFTGRSDYPLSYTPKGGKEQFWTNSDYFQVSSMTSINEEHRDLGFCALGRAISLIQLMLAVYEHDKEVLGAKAPRGLLLLKNVSENQWVQAMTERAVNLAAMEREYYGGVAVLAQEGVDDVDAKLIALSQLPANFDLEKTTNLMMYGLALVFDRDPREFWPVSQGPLGSGNETQIQHTKASGKGGLSFILAYQDQLQQELPETLEFQFEQRDIGGELLEAQVKKAWADVGAVLFDKGQGPLTIDETRIFLAEAGVIPTEWTEAPDEATAESSGEVSGQKRSIDNERWISQESMWASAFKWPLEPLIKRDSLGKSAYLYSSGFDFLKRNKLHPMARSMAAEYGRANPVVTRDIFGHSFQVLQPAQLTVSRAAEILYDEGDVTITMDDVDKAFSEAAERVGPEFEEMLRAE